MLIFEHMFSRLKKKRKKKRQTLLLGRSGWKTFFFNLRAILSWVFRLLGRQLLVLPLPKKTQQKGLEEEDKEDILIPASANGYLSGVLLRQLKYFY